MKFFAMALFILTPAAGFSSGQTYVAGFDFGGFNIRPALVKGTACPQIATPESDACLFKAKGKTSYDESCNTLCTEPMAK